MVLEKGGGGRGLKGGEFKVYKPLLEGFFKHTIAFVMI